MVVSFEEKAWVDVHTHIHCLQEVLGPINKLLAEENSAMKGVVIEDNLSSHKTDVVNDHWCTELDHFISTVFVPSNMMSNVQVVDRLLVSDTRLHITEKSGRDA